MPIATQGLSVIKLFRGALALAQQRLENVGVQISEIRPGRKPGTVVATVTSHHLGIATILLGRA
ncbi:MAG: hypothetical protein OIF35_05595 [Cellvibrionaceae bacterium]|nr:hypothetical protein [Cellvibrionaceae bacterium]